MAVRNPNPVLTGEWMEFIQAGLSISVGSASAGGVPQVVRAYGCRVAADGRTVRLIFPVSQAQPVLDAIRETGNIAASFCKPSTHLSIQLKGRDARMRRVDGLDVEAVRKQTTAFRSEIMALGFDEAFVCALTWSESDDLAAVTFTPSDAFLQTPGPRAGNRLRGSKR